MGTPREFDRLLAHAAEAPWRPVVDTVYPLTGAATAHRRLEPPERFGKVVLAIDEGPGPRLRLRWVTSCHGARSRRPAVSTPPLRRTSICSSPTSSAG